VETEGKPSAKGKRPAQVQTKIITDEDEDDDGDSSRPESPMAMIWKTPPGEKVS
jgi:hypothetical protein